MGQLGQTTRQVRPALCVTRIWLRPGMPPSASQPVLAVGKERDAMVGNPIAAWTGDGLLHLRPSSEVLTTSTVPLEQNLHTPRNKAERAPKTAKGPGEEPVPPGTIGPVETPVAPPGGGPPPAVATATTAFQWTPSSEVWYTAYEFWPIPYPPANTTHTLLAAPTTRVPVAYPP